MSWLDEYEDFYLNVVRFHKNTNKLFEEMAKVRIKHPETGVVYVVDVDNLTAEDIKRLERLNIAEEVKPKRKRKKMSDKHRTTEYKNVEHKKDEQTENDKES